MTHNDDAKTIRRRGYGWRMAAVLVALLVASLLSQGATTRSIARASNPLVYTGVNLAGAEFGLDTYGHGTLPGTYGLYGDYYYPTHDDIDYFQSKGMNVMRIPFRWERLEPTLPVTAGDPVYFDQTELGRLDDVVNYATGKGLHVIVDPHNYARYQLNGTPYVIGMPGSPVQKFHFTSFWGTLASHYKYNGGVFFDLMNEPFDGFVQGDPSQDLDTGVWVDDANGAIGAIRDSESNGGINHLILVPGMQYSNANSWFATWYGNRANPYDSNGKPNSVYLLNISDPGNNYAYEVHQYIDQNKNGTASDCTYDPVPDLQPVTDWLRANGRRAWLGELSTGDDEGTCHTKLDDWMNHLESNNDVWLGWTWWAAGVKLGNLKSLEPGKDGAGNYIDQPQLTWLITGGHLH